jgi:hypothetical protein
MSQACDAKAVYQTAAQTFACVSPRLRLFPPEWVWHAQSETLIVMGCLSTSEGFLS